MKKIVGIVPNVIERRNSINIVVENNIVIFLKKCFPKSKFIILFETKIENKFDIIIFSGGNSIINLIKNKSNKYREKLDNYYFKYSLKKNIPILGICHGAQFFANFFKSKIIRKKGHTNTNHVIELKSKNKSFVNSFHDFSITKLGPDLEGLAWTKNGSIEAFKHKNKKILGIMWHPERYKTIKKFDLKFIKKNL